MQVVGDPDGVAALKALAAEHRDYLKFLLEEAKTATGNVAAFKAADGTPWELALKLDTGDIEVRRPAAPPAAP